MRSIEFGYEGREDKVLVGVGVDGLVRACIKNHEGYTEYACYLTPLGSGRYHLRMGSEVREAFVERGPGGSVLVRFAEGTVALETLDPFRDTTRRGRGGAGGARKVLAPIPGRVVDVLVKIGDEVTAGQPVVVVEAMKMANELRAPIAGRVTQVAVSPGLPVEAGTLLVVVEA